MTEPISKKIRGTGVTASHLWIWGPMVVCLAGILLYIHQRNHIEFFYWLNSLSRYTGDDTWALITILSNGLISFVLLLPFLRRYPRQVVVVLLAAVLFTIIDHLTKFSGSYRRPPRLLAPNLVHVIGPFLKYRSFPSGHASMIVSLLMAWGLSTRLIVLRWALVIAVLVIAFSRCVVSAHWPIDVTVGILIGWFSCYVGFLITQHITFFCRPKVYRVIALLLVLTGVAATIVGVEGYRGYIVWIVRGFCFILTIWGFLQWRKIPRVTETGLLRCPIEEQRG